jgi:hypothetical protein
MPHARTLSQTRTADTARRTAATMVTSGSVCVLGGVGATLAIYSVDGGALSYFIASGAIAFGLADLVRGLGYRDRRPN